jgi:hypothetical protein
MAPKPSQEVSTRRTHPVNANAHPGRPVLEAEAEERLQNTKRKPRTKNSKVTDDPYTNESPEQTSARIQKAAQRCHAWYVNDTIPVVFVLSSICLVFNYASLILYYASLVFSYVYVYLFIFSFLALVFSFTMYL